MAALRMAGALPRHAAAHPNRAISFRNALVDTDEAGFDEPESDFQNGDAVENPACIAFQKQADIPQGLFPIAIDRRCFGG
jgi:hypothetical protein